MTHQYIPAHMFVTLSLYNRLVIHASGHEYFLYNLLCFLAIFQFHRTNKKEGKINLHQSILLSLQLFLRVERKKTKASKNMKDLACV